MATLSGIGLRGLGLGLASGFLGGGSLPLGKRFSNTIGAYSLRDIGADGGAVVDVFDGTSTTVSYTASQIQNGDHASGASSDRFVSKWYDQSGSGNHLVQTSNGDQPKICDSNGNAITNENGDYAILFNPQGTGNTRHFDFVGDKTIKSIFYVADPLNSGNDHTNYQAVIGRNNDNRSYIFHPTNNLSYAISMDGDEVASDTGTWYQNGASGVNGGNVGTFGDVLNDTTALQNVIYDDGSPFTQFNALGYFGTTKYYWRGSMTEVLIYDDYKNDDRIDIRDAINDYYNLF